jgi:hypothetical protein
VDHVLQVDHVQVLAADDSWNCQSSAPCCNLAIGDVSSGTETVTCYFKIWYPHEPEYWTTTP